VTPEQREFDLLTKLTLVRTDLYEVLKVCGIESAGIMTFQEDLLAVKRYVLALQGTVDELLKVGHV
jgi:hypothetical protein